MQSPLAARRRCSPACRTERRTRHSTFDTRLAPSRRAFTLIELLIVLAIIGILAGLLLGGVFGVFGRARGVQVTAEISSLEKAIADFKLRFGIEPPSYFVFYEDGPNWATTAAAKRSRAIVMRVWPDYDFTVQRNLNGNGSSTDVITLQSTEALLFFLGGSGVLDTTRTINERQPLGFSTNPTNPFVAGGQRIGPFHEFDLSRFIDIDGDGNPEYLDPIPGQLLPYLYFSSYEGAGYRPFGLDGTAGNADDEILERSGTDVIQGLYLTNDGSWPMAGGRPGSEMPENSDYINPKSFQILSPGQDFTFGVGGTYIRGKGLAVFGGVQNDTSPMDGIDDYRSSTVRQPEFDNITNFSSGVLGDVTFSKPAI